MTKRSHILDSKLENADPHIKKYVRNLESYVGKLETENAHLKADNVVKNIRIKSLQSQLSSKPVPIQFVSGIRKKPYKTPPTSPNRRKNDLSQSS